MFPEQLKKILNLIKTTGDRVILFDHNTPDESYVLMDLNNYAGLVENKVLTQPHPVASVAPEMAKEKEKTSILENLTEEDLTDKINREISMWKNRENSPYLGEENKTKKPWQIPSQVKEKAQEVE